MPSFTFTSPGNFTWIVPTDCTSIDFELWGAGGNGSDGSSGDGGGGGGGGYCSKAGWSVTPGNTVSLQIGAGGSGNSTILTYTNNFYATAGANGGTGAGGAGGSATTDGPSLDDSRTGGDGYSGDTNGGGGGGASGESGVNGATATSQTGASAVSTGGSGGNGGDPSTDNATNGTTPGGGGGGCSNGNTTFGVGGNGQIKLTFNAGYTQTSTLLPGNTAGANWNLFAGDTKFDDGTAATADFSTYSGSQLLSRQYGFSIPSNHIVMGIQIMVKKKADVDSTQYVTDSQVTLLKDNGGGGSLAAGNDKHDSSTHWPADGTWLYETYGSHQDLWGTTWDNSEVEANGFGAMISAQKNGAGSDTAYVDVMYVTIFHDVPTYHVFAYTRPCRLSAQIPVRSIYL